MADEEIQPAAEPAEQPMQYVLQKIYAKDVSFELPNAPAVFQDSGQAENQDEPVTESK